eukprot:scaffold29891_cov21-Prasinocladus_malaysianus.AAC.1
MPTMFLYETERRSSRGCLRHTTANFLISELRQKEYISFACLHILGAAPNECNVCLYIVRTRPRDLTYAPKTSMSSA